MLLNVPGFKINIKQYQHRTKHRHDAGYSGRITDRGRIIIQKNWYTTVSVQKAYIVRWKNLGTTPASADIHFSLYDKSRNKVDSFIQVSGQVLPGKSTEVPFQLQFDKVSLIVDAVEVHTQGTEPIYTRMIKGVPRMWSFKIWIMAAVMTFFVSVALTKIPAPEFPASILPILAITAFAMAFMNRTPIWFMFIYLILVPFTGYDNDLKGQIVVYGVGYLVLVWNKRANFRDFLCPNATPWSLL